MLLLQGDHGRTPSGAAPHSPELPRSNELGLVARDEGGVRTADTVQKAEDTVEEPVQEVILGFGRVVDTEGRPVGGADVWLFGIRGDDVGEILCQSDRHGLFRWPLYAGAIVTARHDDFAPSPRYSTNGADPAAVFIIVIGSRSFGIIDGVLLDQSSRRLSGIKVEVTPALRREVDRTGRVVFSAAPLAGTSNDEGRFTIGPLPLGPNTIRTSGLGYVPYHGIVQISLGVQGVSIALRKGAILHGQVVSANGDPVASAKVRATIAGANRAVAKAVTDAAGAFFMTGLDAGDYAVIVTSRRAGKARVGLQITGLDEQFVTITLEGTFPVTGVVLSSDGVQRPYVVDVLTPSGRAGLFEQRIWTGEGGKFSIPDFPIDPRKIEIRNASSSLKGLVASRESVVRGEHVVVQLAPIDDMTSSVEGMILDSEGKPLAGFDLNLSSESRSAYLSTIAGPAGRFRFDAVISSHDYILYGQHGSTILKLPTFSVPADHHLDLGPIRAPEGGRIDGWLCCTEHGIEGIALSNHATGLAHTMSRDERRIWSEFVVPGDYSVHVYLDGTTKEALRLTILPGVAHEVTVDLHK